MAKDFSLTMESWKPLLTEANSPRPNVPDVIHHQEYESNILVYIPQIA